MLFKSNGKILLSSEYLVIDGAKSIALPAKLTQDLLVSKCDKNTIEWQSFNKHGNLWYEDRFIVENNNLVSQGKENLISEKIISLLNHIAKTNKLKSILGNKFITKLHFEKKWGLGSSSTFVNNLAKWANVDPYKLLFSTFEGSGYDIACCDVNHPIIYNKIENSIIVKKANFKPPFIEHLFLIYLGKKQNTQSSIENYLKIQFNKYELIKKINSITDEFLKCSDLNQFEELIEEHEAIISNLISIRPIQESTFSDYKNGKIKSLGSWGGDFILATSKNKDLSYFHKKGLITTFPLSDMVHIN
tara:strand:+ start:396 stop:1304 length:909 start_codon:yes stop_codon:yes gene_type:complete